VTIEDLVEEIIGDIKDEYDKEEQIFERVSETEFLVDAKITVDELNERIDADLPAEDYDTLGGFVYTQLDKIPAVGDVVRYKDLTITVLGTKGRRVTKVKIVRELAPDASGDHVDRAETARGDRDSDRSRRESRESRDSRESREQRNGREQQASDRATGRDHIVERLR
jgi:NhaP-type Na+/H+ and K+/H+ antiporter